MTPHANEPPLFENRPPHPDPASVFFLPGPSVDPRGCPVSVDDSPDGREDDDRWVRLLDRARPFVDDAIDRQTGRVREVLDLMRAERLPFAVCVIPHPGEEPDLVQLRFGIPQSGEEPVWFCVLDGANVGVLALDGKLVYIPDELLDADLVE